MRLWVRGHDVVGSHPKMQKKVEERESQMLGRHPQPPEALERQSVAAA